MYGHEAIRDLKEGIKLIGQIKKAKRGADYAKIKAIENLELELHNNGIASGTMREEFYKEIIGKIKEATHYNITKDEFSTIIGLNTIDDSVEFIPVKLPTDKCWIEFEHDAITEDKKSIRVREGILAKTIRLQTGVRAIEVIVCSTVITNVYKNDLAWVATPVKFIISMGEDFTSEDIYELAMERVKFVAPEYYKPEADSKYKEEIVKDYLVKRLFPMVLVKGELAKGLIERVAECRAYIRGFNIWLLLISTMGIKLKENIPTKQVIKSKKRRNYKTQKRDVAKFIYYTMEDEINGIDGIKFQEGLESGEEKRLQQALYYGYKTHQEKIMYWFFEDQPYHPDRLVWANEKRNEERNINLTSPETKSTTTKIDIKRRPTDRALQGRLNVEIIYPSGKVYEGRLRATRDDIAVIEPSIGDRVAWLCDLKTVKDLTSIDLRVIPSQRVYHTPSNIEWLKSFNYINLYDY